jgi:uncharacterized protein involved in cysteine biosynthesis
MVMGVVEWSGWLGLVVGLLVVVVVVVSIGAVAVEISGIICSVYFGFSFDAILVLPLTRTWL